MIIHPYLRYAQALLMEENFLSSVDEIKMAHIIAEIEKGLETFSVKPDSEYIGKTDVEFKFVREKNNANNFIFLSPNIVVEEKPSVNTWNAAIKYIADNNKNQPMNKSTEITMSQIPVVGEFSSFSLNGNIGRGKTKSSIYEQGLGLVTTLTPLKPCLQYKIVKKGDKSMFNICIIPDLPLDKMRDFIFIFKKMRLQQLDNNLMTGNVVAITNKKNEIISYSPRRPHIFKGNFPNPPKSSALGSIALLGAIGEFAKHSDVSDKAMSVLESLKSTTMYMMKYGGATTFTYNHYIIDLAKEDQLNTIVDSLYYSKLYNQERRTSESIEYQKFDLFTSRFLQLFTPSAFRDFLSFRAEYPNKINKLLNTYFTKMEKIDPRIVASARQLGKWLNLVAYFAAKSEIKNDTPNYWEELRKVKSKVLVELESSTFAAKSGDALIAQAVTRAGRLSGLDAPEAASLFMEKTSSGELSIDHAKNLLIAFTRLRNKRQLEDQPQEIAKKFGEDDVDETEDFSNE